MARRQIRTFTPTELARVQQGALVRIVDDDDSLRDALRFVLETEGWRVADYRSANDFFRGDAPSVPGCVVMDVRMPGLTGIEAQAVMNERGFSLPVIFLTGHGDIDMAVMALHEGAADFIQKPVDNERLLAVIASTAFESLSGRGRGARRRDGEGALRGAHEQGARHREARGRGTHEQAHRRKTLDRRAYGRGAQGVGSEKARRQDARGGEGRARGGRLTGKEGRDRT